MLFGANLRAILTNQWFDCTWSVEHQLVKQITVLSTCCSFEADEALELLLVSWFLLILYQSNLKLNVHVSYHRNPA